MFSDRSRDPLGPAEWVAALLCALVTLPLLLLPFLLVDLADGGDRSVSVLQFRSEQACVPATNEEVGGTEVRSPRPLRTDASVRGEVLDACLEDPTLPEQTAASLQDLGTYAVLLVVAFGLRRLVRQARRELFGIATASHTTRLGWFLVVGSLVAGLLGSLGNTFVLRRVLEDSPSWATALSPGAIHWGFVAVGLGVVTVGRVLRWAVVLQEEVDATV